MNTYNEGDDEIKDIPVVLPEVGEVIHPLQDDFQHEAVERAVVEDIKKQLQRFVLRIFAVVKL